MILDAGVLISVDRGEQSARELLTAAARSGTELHTSHPVVAQVWHASSRQARLAKFLSACTVRRCTPGPDPGQSSLTHFAAMGDGSVGTPMRSK